MKAELERIRAELERLVAIRAQRHFFAWEQDRYAALVAREAELLAAMRDR